MLVISRNKRQRFMIGDDIIITIVDVDFINHRVRIGIEAPATTKVYREEVYEKNQIIKLHCNKETENQD